MFHTKWCLCHDNRRHPCTTWSACARRQMPLLLDVLVDKVDGVDGFDVVDVVDKDASRFETSSTACV